MGRYITLAILAVPLLVAQPAESPARSLPQTLTFRSTVDDSDQPYAIYVPRSFRPDAKYPLVVSLHSEESNHRLNLRQVFAIPSRLAQMESDDFRFFPAIADSGYIVACPFARGTMGYEGVAETDVYDMLAEIQRRFPIDPDRVYLTGISMGGGGALRFALTRPDVWAAVAPVAAAVPPGLEVLAGNALNLPIRLFHGELDPIVPVAGSRGWHRRLLDLGSQVDYIEYPAVRHNAWDFAYRGGSLFEWFGQRRRNRFPDSIRFVTQSYRYAGAYWVQVDGLTPGVLASIDVRRAATSEIRVQTANLDGFTLTPDRAATLVIVDGVPLKVKSAPSLSFEKVAGRWRAGRFQPAGKRPAAEGPISEALSGRQLYVYGTLRATGPEEIAARRKTAETAASLSSSRALLGLRFPVKPDSAVTGADIESSDLILLGGRDTNSVSARFASTFPLELEPGAADYGLLFIAPVGRHYALVSSGLPWWSGRGHLGAGGNPFAPESYRALSTLGDYVLFKGGLDNIVAEGRFNREWKIPPDASARLLATGTVTIH